MEGKRGERAGKTLTIPGVQFLSSFFFYRFPFSERLLAIFFPQLLFFALVQSPFHVTRKKT